MFQNKVIVITGENIYIDGSQTRLMIYHGDYGWTLDSYTTSVRHRLFFLIPRYTSVIWV